MLNFLKSKTAKAAVGLLAIAMFVMLGGIKSASAAITHTLKYHSTYKTEVMELQNGLNSMGFANPALVADGSFGAKTLAAVKAYQANKGLVADGIFGAMSRGAWTGTPTGGVQGNCPTGYVMVTPVAPLFASCAPSSGTVPQTGPITAMLSSDTPAAGTIIAGQANADLAHITFTGTGTVNSVTLMRGGVSDQSTLTNVYLYDGATRLTDGYSFNNAGMLTMNNVNLAVNGSKNISVKADVYGSTNSYSINVALSSFTVGTTVTTANIKSNDMYIATGTGVLGTAALTVASPSPTAATINAGSINQNLWSNTLSIGLHASKLYGMTVKMIGSAPSNTIANAGLFVDGVKVASATINGDMRFVFDTSSNPVNLTTGLHQIEVRGDVVGGAYRNFYLSLEKSADLAIRDGQVNGGGVVAITPTYLSNPVNNMLGGLVTINNGTLTINQDTSFNNTTTLVGGATNVKMAAFKFTAYGEDVKVNSLSFTPTLTLTSPASPDSLLNVGLYVNGGQVGSSVTSTTATTLTFSSLGSNLIVPVGSPVVVEIRGDVINGGSVTVTAGTVKFDLDAGSSNAQGVTSGQLTSTASAGGQTLTVSSSNVTFAQTTGWAASSVAPNATNVKIGTFTLSTGSAEGVNVNNILVGITGTAISSNQVTNITVKDGATTLGTPVGNPTASNNFSVNVPVNVSATKTFDVYADIGSGAAGLTVIPAMTITYRGTTSNVTTTSSAITGSTITANVSTIIAGGVTFVPSSSIVSQFLVGGQASVPIGTFNVKANTLVAGSVIKDVTFTVPANTISSVTMNGVTGQVVGTTAILYNVNVTVPADASGINIPVTAALVCVSASGGGCSGVSNSTVNASITTLTYFNGSAIVSISPTAITVDHALVASKPTVSMTGSSGGVGSFTNGNQKIGEFTVSADAAGDIKLEAIPVTVSVSVAAITASSIELRDASGSTVIVGTGGVNGSAGLSASGTFAFNTSFRTIAKGTSETFTVYATFTGVTTGASETFGLGAKASFLWTDVIGAQANITGAKLNTYPTATQSKTF